MENNPSGRYGYDSREAIRAEKKVERRQGAGIGTAAASAAASAGCDGGGGGGGGC